MFQIKKGWATGATFVTALLTGEAQGAIDPEWINQKLNSFNNDPKGFFHDAKNVEKLNADDLTPAALEPLFSPQSIESGDFILQKDRVQKTAKIYMNLGRAPYLKNDRPQDVVDTFAVSTLQEMESSNLRKSTLPESPWSGDYWPIAKGGIAKRYNDPHFPNSTNWKVNIDYLYSNSCSVDQLSPAEKYDLLVGDTSWTLTRAVTNEGKSYYDSDGSVAIWMGVCHGWAPAAFMLPRPTQAIYVISADGKTRIPIYPHDIKALASLLWAKAAPTGRFIGGRCNIKNPREDANGRIIEQDCFDTNPGTWHLSVVNQIGVSKRSIILDATYDAEVWNQPGLGYEYSYFNPQTRKAVDSLDQAMVPIRNFSADKFSQYRSNQAAYVAGVVMQFTYIAETNPNAQTKDSPSSDRRVSVKYIYDLELDSNMRIIGGEWYQRAHPDFLWVPIPKSRAVSVSDEYLERNPEGWDSEGPLPKSWMLPAVKASRYGQPLAAVVEALTVFSNLAAQ